MHAGLIMFAALFRATTRLVWLAGELTLATAWSERRALLGQKHSTLSGPSNARRSWLHRTAARVLRVLEINVRVTGPIPTRGLLVANHLSYLDIVVLAALTPCVFVAKSEVKSWPVFGWFARRSGTIFVDRGRRSGVVRTGRAIHTALQAGALVVLFPEGTSSGGAQVRPFKSSLLEPVVGTNAPLSVAALHYKLADGDVARDVCYWGEHTLGPHLLRLLSKRAVRASVVFAPVGHDGRDRKQLAAYLHAEVSALHTSLQGGTARAASRRAAQSGAGQAHEARCEPSCRPPGADGMLAARAFPPSRLFDAAHPNT